MILIKKRFFKKTKITSNFILTVKCVSSAEISEIVRLWQIGSYRHFFTVCLLGYTSLDTFISHDYSHPYE